MPSPARQSIAVRGVYRLPFLSAADEVILVAVSARGQRLAERCVPRGVDVELETAQLEDTLAQLDPRPLLRVI